MPCLMCVKYGRVSTRSVLHQCDQMTRLFAQYLAIYNNGILPKRIKIFPKLVQHFARHKINPQEMAQIFPKVAKFHQIWSHCSFFLSNLPIQLFCPRLEEVKNGERERETTMQQVHKNSKTETHTRVTIKRGGGGVGGYEMFKCPLLKCLYHSASTYGLYYLLIE